MERKKKYRISGSLIKIQEILSNLEAYGKIHPLILSVQKTRTDDDGGTQEYRITERPYRWMPINIQYTAKVTAEEHSVAYEISEIPFTKANITYELNDIDAGNTEIIFNLRINSTLIGKGILMNKMIKAQDKLMQSMEIALANA